MQLKPQKKQIKKWNFIFQELSRAQLLGPQLGRLLISFLHSCQ